MKRMPFERPTEHYDERIREIDEQICSLIKQRKDISGNDPGFPPFELISEWSAGFGIHEDFLKALFGTLMNEEQFKPMVEPAEFRKHISLLKAAEKGGRFYTLSSIRQYRNASVLVLNVDWDGDPEPLLHAHEHNHFELFISEQYDCRMMSGGSRSDHAFYKYVVSPPLPDELSGIEFRFIHYRGPFNKNKTGDEILFKV